jgi:hypothetical protein
MRETRQRAGGESSLLGARRIRAAFRAVPVVEALPIAAPTRRTA